MPTLRPLPPRNRNLGELLLRDVASLFNTSELIRRSIKSLRPQCSFSPALASALDTIAATSDAGELLLYPPLLESGAILPHFPDTRENTLLKDFFARLPAHVTPGVLAADVAANLRLLTQHVELKARLAAQQALHLGQNALCHALTVWAAEWRTCGQALHSATARARAHAYVADVPEHAMRQAS